MQALLRRLAPIGLLLIAVSSAGFVRAGSAPAISFTPAWQPMLLGDGGNAQGVHAFASGTILSHVDTYNAFRYVPSGSCTIGAKTLAAPCHQPMVSTLSVPSASWDSILGDDDGVTDIVECQGNTNVFYAIFGGSNNGAVWVSTNRGTTWVKTPQPALWRTNNGPIQHDWIGCDPADSTGNRVYINTRSSGAFFSANGTLGGSSTWNVVAGITASSNNDGGSIVFDPTSSVVGGVTQHFFISSDGIGIYETFNGGGTGGVTSFTLTTGTPTLTEYMVVDKFGQLWSTPGFDSSSGNVFKYASGSWSTIAAAASGNFLMAILLNPTCGTGCSTVGNNQVMYVDSFGQIGVSLNNGASWTFAGHTTVSASAPQAAWLGTADYGSNLSPDLNINGATIDPTGKIWSAGGVSLWTTQQPITGCPLSCTIATTGPPYVPNSVGIEQLVVNAILSPPGGPPTSAVWDRGAVLSPNPDVFATKQYTQVVQAGGPITASFGIDYALQTLPVVGGTHGCFIVASLEGQGSASATSSDCGNSYTVWPVFPTGHGNGEALAVSTTTNWCVVPGNGGTANTQIWCTTDAAATSGNWHQATVPGTPTFIPGNQGNNVVWPLAADKQTAGAFYAIDTTSFYYSSNGNTASPSFAKIASPFGGEFGNGEQKIQAMPGQANTLLVGLGNGGTHFWKTTNANLGASATFGQICTGFTQVQNFGFGAPKPGSSLPTIYAAGIIGSSDFFIIYSTDGGTTCQKINVPISQQQFALNSLNPGTWINGDLNVYGRIYYGFIGSGNAYIDMQDACPWVNFDQVSVKAGSSLTGTATLTAIHSGLVPVTGVNFYVDGSQIGSTQTGSGPYSVSWVTGGVTTGAHTLKVEGVGNSCGVGSQNSFSIPITTH